MNEGLEALNILKEELKSIFVDKCKEVLTIEKELRRLEEIDDVLNTGGGIWAENGIVSKELKALEVIKKKKVNVDNFVNTCSKMSYEQYKFMWEEGCFMGVKMTSKEFLTQEEYYLLKGVL